jgi:hypothetical protein
MDNRQIKKITYRKLGKLTTSCEGLFKSAAALRRKFGERARHREYLVETHIATYHMKSGKKLRTIGRVI